jgi:hypothetical protein
MRVVTRILGGLGLAIGLTVSAHGQGAPFKESRLNGAAILVRHPGVQAQLKITKEQNEKFRQASDRAREKFAAEFAKMERIENGAARSGFKRELSQKIIAEVTKELPKILLPEQMKRLEQISMQQAGVQAFDEKPVQEKLKLTPEQLKKIARIREAAGEEYLNIRQSLTDTFEESKKKEHDLKKAIVARAAAILTDEQRVQWKEFVGEPFDFITSNELTAASPTDKKPEEKKPDTAASPQSNKDLRWIDDAVQKHQPTLDERKYDQIGWADGIIAGLELGKKHRRPIIMHTYNDGRIGQGRC